MAQQVILDITQSGILKTLVLRILDFPIPDWFISVEKMSGIGLTAGQVKEIQRTWALVNQNQQHHGITILMAMFNKFPDYKKFFKPFDGVAIKDLPEHKILKYHATRFMKALTEFVDNLENKEELLRLVMKMVESHHKRNLNMDQFTNVLGLVNPYLKDALKDELNADGASGWKKTVDVLLSVIAADIKQLDEAQK